MYMYMYMYVYTIMYICVYMAGCPKKVLLERLIGLHPGKPIYFHSLATNPRGLVLRAHRLAASLNSRLERSKAER